MIYSKFEDIPVSTKTFVVKTNMIIDLQKIFDILPVCEYVALHKKRGRKKKGVPLNTNDNLQDGSIISIDFFGKIKGTILKKKKKEKPKYFRNSMTVIMILDNKKINFKITKNGVFQITGCKTDSQSEKCVKFIYRYIKGSDCYRFVSGIAPIDTPTKILSALFIPCMRNVDFSLGFNLDREKLSNYIITHTDYLSNIAKDTKYTGVNIKLIPKKTIHDLTLKRMFYDNTKDDWGKTEIIPYTDYVKTLNPKEQKKKLNKEHYNTFLIFYSGKIIYSSMCELFARDSYYEFISIIEKNKEEFKEKLD
jgi:hypothetical protein